MDMCDASLAGRIETLNVPERVQLKVGLGFRQFLDTARARMIDGQRARCKTLKNPADRGVGRQPLWNNNPCACGAFNIGSPTFNCTLPEITTR